MARKQPPQELRTETLHKIHQGVPAAAIDSAIRNALLDCADRPNEEKARTVTVQIIMKPIPDQTRQNCEQVEIQIKASSSIPKMSTRAYIMDVEETRDGRGNPIARAHFVPNDAAIADEPAHSDAEDD